MTKGTSSKSQTVWDRPKRFAGCPISTSKKLYDAILSFIPHDNPRILTVDESAGVVQAQLQYFADRIERDLNLWKLEAAPKLPNQFLHADQIRGPSEVNAEFVAQMRVVMFVCTESWDQMKRVLDTVNKEDCELNAIIWLGTADMWTKIGSPFSRWFEQGFEYGTWKRDVRADNGMGLTENEMGVIFHKDNEMEGEGDWEWETTKEKRKNNWSMPPRSESDEGLTIVNLRDLKIS